MAKIVVSPETVERVESVVAGTRGRVNLAALADAVSCVLASSCPDSAAYALAAVTAQALLTSGKCVMMQDRFLAVA